VSSSPQPAAPADTVYHPFQPKVDGPSLSFALGDSAPRYQLGSVLGSGGNSTVYDAYDTDLKRQVAVKILKPKYRVAERALRRFLNEARIMARLQHPGVVPVHDVGEMSGQLYYAMQKVHGRTLRDLLDPEHPPQNADEIRLRSIDGMLEVFFRACAVMDHAHRLGIIHRDLKPENIMIEDNTATLVLDWGLAKDLKQGESPEEWSAEDNRLETAGAAPELTITGEISGTPAYMSPEQAQGRMAQLECCSDVFALGVVLYEILTGRNPFHEGTGGNTRLVLGNVKHLRLSPPQRDREGRRVSPELQAILEKCLEKIPASRYPDASALLHDLRNWRNRQPVTAYGSGVDQQLFKFFLRHRLGTFVLCLVVTAAVLGWTLVKTTGRAERRLADDARAALQAAARSHNEAVQAERRRSAVAWEQAQRDWGRARGFAERALDEAPEQLGAEATQLYLHLAVEDLSRLAEQNALTEARSLLATLDQLSADRGGPLELGEIKDRLQILRLRLR
jgi:tRNA A-37 threonylcarbamoyl transferase component Bud32